MTHLPFHQPKVPNPLHLTLVIVDYCKVQKQLKNWEKKINRRSQAREEKEMGGSKSSKKKATLTQMRSGGGGAGSELAEAAAQEVNLRRQRMKQRAEVHQREESKERVSQDGGSGMSNVTSVNAEHLKHNDESLKGKVGRVPLGNL
nr:hypothetical protein Iba_chr10aCG12080 [Ipomoea batatas]